MEEKTLKNNFSLMKKGVDIIRRVSIVVGLVWIGTAAWAQSADLQLAEEYFGQEAYDKAAEQFRKGGRRGAYSVAHYEMYLTSLQKLERHQDALKLIRQQRKEGDDALRYDVDYGQALTTSGESRKANQHFKKLIDETLGDPRQEARLGSLLVAQQALDQAEMLYLAVRRKRPQAFSAELAEVYGQRGQKAQRLDLLLQLLETEPARVQEVQNSLQQEFVEDQEYRQLDSLLLARIQKNPDQAVFNDLLIWSYVQQRDFFSAFQQAKAIDRRQKRDGAKTLEVGLIAFNNEAFDVSEEVFGYLLEKYANSPRRSLFQRYLIESKEAVVKRTFPVDTVKIRGLIADYARFSASQQDAETQRAVLSRARLHAFYLDEFDQATQLLEELLKASRLDAALRGESKLNLGDVYLLKGEPWESALLYGQVEKAEKDRPLGHEAKLRNAKLNYYKGDFELAQGHLDVLKMATSREIANDAMALSLLIQDNTALDTSTAALQRYAEIELMLFRNRRGEALRALDKLLGDFPRHSLTDEIYWRKADILVQNGDYASAVAELQRILDTYSSDILGDDALYRMAVLQEERLRERERAMDLYTQLLRDYPGSIYVADARKRFRRLRGDLLN